MTIVFHKKAPEFPPAPFFYPCTFCQVFCSNAMKISA